MSSRTRGRAAALLAGDGDPVIRAGSLASVAVLAASYLAVLYHVVDVVGGVAVFVLLVVGAVVLAAFIEEALTDRQALVLAAVLLAAGLGGYLLAVPPSFWTDFSLARTASEIVALLTGFSVLAMVRAGVWALAVTPAPTFLVAYFTFRGEYVRAVAAAGATLGFFVLTGDSGTVGTLLGVLGGASALGFSGIERYGGTRTQIEGIAVAVAVMILASAAVTAVPADQTTDPVLTDVGSVESDLRSTGDNTVVGGSIWLSPKVRFTVEADQEAYWRTKAYDRFTGTGWVRTGEPGPLADADVPPGPRDTVVQTVTASTTLGSVPAAAAPTNVSGIDTQLTPQGTLVSETTLAEGQSYTVTSSVPNATVEQLRDAGTDYPEAVRERYLQLPESTPQRVADRTATVTADAETPYDVAAVIGEHLESQKGYSTSVPPPEGNVADELLFEREEGYCVYFATTMVTMLRSQGIPARYAVGYTPGQRVAEDEWVVRGLDSHAWVEVYFPDYGWIRFDPTPGAERLDAENSRLEEARENDVEGVDAAGSDNGTWTPTTTEDSGPDGLAAGAATTETIPGPVIQRTPDNTIALETETTTNTTVVPADEGIGSTGGGIDPPSMETVAVWSVLIVGLAAVGRRTGVAERAYRTGWVRWQPATGDHRQEIEGAFARVEYVLGREHRPRRGGETVREYVASIDADDRVRELARIRERARYAADVSPETARRARELADDVVADRLVGATTFNRLVS